MKLYKDGYYLASIFNSLLQTFTGLLAVQATFTTGKMGQYDKRAVLADTDCNFDAGYPNNLPGIIDCNDFNFPGVIYHLNGQANNQLGMQLISAGDYDNNGRTDFIVCAPGYKPTAASPKDSGGAVYLVFDDENPQGGDLSLLPVNKVISIRFPETTCSFNVLKPVLQRYYYSNYAITGVGSFDGDAYDDVLVISFNVCGKTTTEDFNSEHYLSFRLIYGQSRGSALLTDEICASHPDWPLSGSGFISIAGLGDVNNDNKQDIAIAVSSPTPDGSSVFILLGADKKPEAKRKRDTQQVSSCTQFNTISLKSPTYGVTKVFKIGDYNHDGKADVLLTNPDYSPMGGYSKAGVAIVLFLSSEITSGFNVDTINFRQGRIFFGSSDFARLGQTAAAMGDVTADGIDDFIISERSSDAILIPGRITPSFGSLVYTFPQDRTGSHNRDYQYTSEYNFGFRGTKSHISASFAEGVDLNGDGINDLVVAHEWDSFPGRTESGSANFIYRNRYESDPYVTTVSLTNGDDYVSVYGQSQQHIGRAIASLVDFTGDGRADIVVSGVQYDNTNGYQQGYVYLIPGKYDSEPPKLVLTGVPITIFSISNYRKQLDSSILNVTDNQVSASRDLRLIVTHKKNCYLTLGYYFQQDWFTLQALQLKQIYIHYIGNQQPPELSLVASDGDSCSYPTQALTFDFHTPPVLSTQPVHLNAYDKVTLTTGKLNATDLEQNDPKQLVYTAELDQNALISVNTNITNTFTQQDVNSLLVTLVSTSNQQPSINLTVNDGTWIQSDLPVTKLVIEFNTPPRLIQQFFPLIQNQQLTLNSSNLVAEDDQQNSAHIWVTVTSKRNCHFTDVSNVTLPVNNFTQQAINQGQILLHHDGQGLIDHGKGPDQPTFHFKLFDGFSESTEYEGNITFTYYRITGFFGSFQLKPLATALVTKSNIVASSNHGNPEDWVIQVLDISDAQFMLNEMNVTDFTVAQLHAQQVALRSTSLQNPNFTLGITDGVGQRQAESVSVVLNTPPVILNNDFQFEEDSGKTTITTSMFQVEDTTTPADQLIIHISDLHFGEFYKSSNLLMDPITFTQQAINNNAIQFLVQGGENQTQVPAFTITVSDDTYNVTTVANIQYTTVDDPAMFEIVPFTISLGEPFILTTQQFRVTDPDSLPNEIYFLVEVEKLHHIQFINTTNSLPISEFTLADINMHNSTVALTTAGASVDDLPRFTIKMRSGKHAPHIITRTLNVYVPPTSAPTPVPLTNAPTPLPTPLPTPVPTPLPNPILEVNYFLVRQRSQYLLQQDDFTITNQGAEPSEVVFLVDRDSRENVHFTSSINDETFIEQFSLQDVLEGNVWLVSENNMLPKFSIQVKVGNRISEFVNVNPGFEKDNKPPVIYGGIGDRIIYQDQEQIISFQGIYSDPEGRGLYFSAKQADGSTLPPWFKLNSQTQTIILEPHVLGRTDFVVFVSDGVNTVNDTFSITVEPLPLQPMPTNNTNGIESYEDFAEWFNENIGAVLGISLPLTLVGIFTCLLRAYKIYIDNKNAINATLVELKKRFKVDKDTLSPAELEALAKASKKLVDAQKPHGVCAWAGFFICCRNDLVDKVNGELDRQGAILSENLPQNKSLVDNLNAVVNSIINEDPEEVIIRDADEFRSIELREIQADKLRVETNNKEVQTDNEDADDDIAVLPSSEEDSDDGMHFALRAAQISSAKKSSNPRKSRHNNKVDSKSSDVETDARAIANLGLLSHSGCASCDQSSDESSVTSICKN